MANIENKVLKVARTIIDRHQHPEQQQRVLTHSRAYMGLITALYKQQEQTKLNASYMRA